MTENPKTPRRRRRRHPVTAREPEPGRLALSVPEAAYLLGCAPNTVWKLLQSDKLSSFHLGRKRLIARSAIEAFIEAGGTGEGEPPR
jgi:excisionase family DNA binding protein